MCKQYFKLVFSQTVAWKARSRVDATDRRYFAEQTTSVLLMKVPHASSMIQIPALFCFPSGSVGVVGAVPGVVVGFFLQASTVVHGLTVGFSLSCFSVSRSSSYFLIASLSLSISVILPF